MWYQLAATTPAQVAYAGAAFDANGYFGLVKGLTSGNSWTSGGYKSTYSFHNIGQWYAAQSGLSSFGIGSTSYLQCTQGTVPTQFNMQTATGTTPWGAINQFVAVLNEPVPYVTFFNGYGGDNKNQWAIAPAGSWVLYGTQPDISISTNNGATWIITSGTNSGNSNLDTRDLAVLPWGCGQRRL